jgi:hypothetical protein
MDAEESVILLLMIKRTIFVLKFIPLTVGMIFFSILTPFSYIFFGKSLVFYFIDTFFDDEGFPK